MYTEIRTYNSLFLSAQVLSNGVSEESGQCPDLKTIQNEGNHIVDEQRGTRPPITSALVNPFGP